MSIEKVTGGYKVRYRTEGGRSGKSRSRTFRLLKEAKAFDADVKSDQARGLWVDPAAGRVTVREYAEQWRVVQVHRPGTAAQVETNFRRHVYPALGDQPLGDRPLASIRPSHVQALVKELDQKLAASTVELVYRYLVAVFLAAVADQVITSSPCRGIRLPKQEPAKVVPLAVEVVEKLAEVLPLRYQALVPFVAGTGLRQGEAFGVTVDRVDFLRRTLTVDRQMVLHVGAPPHLAPLKTAASYRTIPLPTVVLNVLAAHLAAFPAGPDGLVFTNDKGKPISRTRFGDVWRRAVEDAGLPAGTGMHDLRHFYASLLIRHGESPKVVQARLGHASITETMDTYAHLWPDSDDRTREAVDSVLGRGVSSVWPEAGSEG